MASTMAARNAIKRFPLKQCTKPRHFSSRATAPASSILLDHDSSRKQTWTAALLTAMAVTSSAFAADKALAEADPEENTDEESTTILNWSGTHSVELAPGNYHEPETMDELAQLVSKAYREGQHIRPVGSALSPNGLSFDSRGMVCLSNLDKIIDINKEKMTVTVEAGARVSQVLDALRPHGLMLPNLFSIAEHQIGGFVSRGAHGTGAAISPCDGFVGALPLVTPSPYDGVSK